MIWTLSTATPTAFSPPNASHTPAPLNLFISDPAGCPKLTARTHALALPAISPALHLSDPIVRAKASAAAAVGSVT